MLIEIIFCSVYLRCPIEILKERVMMRGRPEEKKLDWDFIVDKQKRDVASQPASFFVSIVRQRLHPHDAHSYLELDAP